MSHYLPSKATVINMEMANGHVDMGQIGEQPWQMLKYWQQKVCSYHNCISNPGRIIYIVFMTKI